MFCQFCGTELTPGSSSCPKCSAQAAPIASAGAEPVQQQAASGLSIAAFVLGICSVMCWCLTGIPAIVVGKMALNAINRGEAPKSGETFAKIGFIVGIVMTSISVLYLIVVGLFALVSAIAS